MVCCNVQLICVWARGVECIICTWPVCSFTYVLPNISLKFLWSICQEIGSSLSCLLLSACTILWCPFLQFCGGLEPTQSLKGKSIRHTEHTLVCGAAAPDRWVPLSVFHYQKASGQTFCEPFEENQVEGGSMVGAKICKIWGLVWPWGHIISQQQ